MHDSDGHLAQDQELARRLPKTWPAFFQRFGRLTDVQRQAIPVILDGENALVAAATASGKTEAACAPLLERRNPLDRGIIIYVSPTRALVNDLYERLRGPVTLMSRRLARRTGDHKTALTEIPDVLLTTPESLDSLLCRGHLREPEGHVLAFVQALVLDEIHVMHGSARGEQLRWLMLRLDRLKQFAKKRGWVASDRIQRVALSATVPDEERIRLTYLGPNSRVVRVPGQRHISVMNPDGGKVPESVLGLVVDHFLRHDVRQKGLVFCNSRRRVDELASDLRASLRGREVAVYAHHGSLPTSRREAAEAAVKNRERVVLVCTSTMELGVDIGDVDVVALDGPPPDVAALLQRVGRGNRRLQTTRVLVGAETSGELVVQSALLECARRGELGPSRDGLQLAVANQQLGSFLFQRSGRSRRSRGQLGEFLTEGLHGGAPTLDPGELLDLLVDTGQLYARDEQLALGSSWVDQAARGQVHSTIEGMAGATIRDESTGEVLATGINWNGDDHISFGGGQYKVVSNESGEVRVRAHDGDGGTPARYSSRWGMLAGDRPWFVRCALDIHAVDWPTIASKDRLIVMHLGGRRDRVVLDMLKGIGSHLEQPQVNDWSISFAARSRFDLWQREVSEQALDSHIRENLQKLESKLGRPSANRGLPLAWRMLEIRSWLAVEDCLRRVKDARLMAVDPRSTCGRQLLAVWEDVASKR